MKNKSDVSRRNFISQTSIGIVAGIVGAAIPSCRTASPEESKKMARRVSVASVDLKGMMPVLSIL